MVVPVMELQNFQIYLQMNLLKRILLRSLREYHEQELLTWANLKDLLQQLCYQTLIGNSY